MLRNFINFCVSRRTNRGVVAPRKGLGENDHKGARFSSPVTNHRSPKIVRTWKPCTNENYKDASFYHL